MLELKTDERPAYVFTNRRPVPARDGRVRVYLVPTYVVLAISRYINVFVLLSMVYAQFHKERRYEYAVGLFAVQGIHLLFKVATYWRSVRIPEGSVREVFGAKVTLQSEHSAFLISWAMILTAFLDDPDGLIKSVSGVALAITVVLLIISRPKMSPNEAKR